MSTKAVLEKFTPGRMVQVHVEVQVKVQVR
jgi:hypothetical protein